jgi:hypothetical protein
MGTPEITDLYKNQGNEYCAVGELQKDEEQEVKTHLVWGGFLRGRRP